jgi:hypothetical protein
MSHNNTEEIEIYKKHKKEIQQNVLMDMTRIFKPEDMIFAAVWKLLCKSDSVGIPREKRRDISCR